MTVIDKDNPPQVQRLDEIERSSSRLATGPMASEEDDDLGPPLPPLMKLNARPPSVAKSVIPKWLSTTNDTAMPRRPSKPLIVGLEKRLNSCFLSADQSL